jgi:broad specificity phosphatase PhoE
MDRSSILFRDDYRRVNAASPATGRNHMQERPVKSSEQSTRAAFPRIFYFRHGETQWSLSGQHTGVTEVPLTAHGEMQAQALRPWVETVEFSHVLTSPRLRARATCQLAGLGGRSQIEPALAEWNYGDYEGRRSVEIRDERPGWNIFQDGCPNGESPPEICERVDRLIARLRALGGDIALFSHGHFGAVFGARWIGLPVIGGQHFTISPASMSVLSLDLSHEDTAVIALWNAVAGSGASTIPLVATSKPAAELADS